MAAKSRACAGAQLGGEGMKYAKPKVLDILMYLHDYLLLAGLYPLFAVLCLCSKAQMYRIAAISVLLWIPIVSGHKLLQRVKSMAVYVLTGIGITFLVAALGYILGAFCRQGRVLGPLITGGASLLIFAVQLAAKANYGSQKKDYLAAGLPAENFHLTPEDIHTIWNTLIPAAWVWPLFLYIVGILLRFEDFLHLMFWVVLADVVVVLLYRYAHSLYEFVHRKSRIAHLPVKSMTMIHRIAGVLLGVILAVCLLPSILFGREFLPDYDNLPDVHIELEQTGSDKNYTVSGAPNAMIEYMEATAQENETPEWIYTLSKVLGAMILFVTVIVVLRGMIRAILEKSQNFAEDGMDEVVFIQTDDRISPKPKRAWWDKITDRMSWQERVRRRYRREIRRATKGTPRATATPSELEQEANLQNTPDLHTLHEEYEKARYDR